MTWGKMDDKFHRNRKVRELRRMKGGREALGAWAFWWSWCLDDAELTGVVPLIELDAADVRAAKLLVQVGLWDQTEDGFRFHDFHEYNPTKSQREHKKAVDRERVYAKRHGISEDVASDSHATPERLADDSLATRERVASTRVPNPTQPNPTVSDTHGTGPIVGGVDPETVRLAYVARWEKHAPGKRLPMVARGFGASVWTELAQALVDAETTEAMLDAAFGDAFVRSTGWTPKAILGCLPRLSTADVRPSSHEAGRDGGDPSLDGGTGKKSILEALRARHDEELLAAERCALRGDADGKARHMSEAARLRAEWKSASRSQAVAS